MLSFTDETTRQSKKVRSRQRGSNPRSTAYEAVALPLGHTGCCDQKWVRGNNILDYQKLGSRKVWFAELTTRTKCEEDSCLRIAYPGDVAQMVERLLSMQEAQGSIPCFSTFFLELLFHQVFSTKRVIGLVV